MCWWPLQSHCSLFQADVTPIMSPQYVLSLRNLVFQRNGGSHVTRVYEPSWLPSWWTLVSLQFIVILMAWELMARMYHVIKTSPHLTWLWQPDPLVSCGLLCTPGMKTLCKCGLYLQACLSISRLWRRETPTQTYANRQVPASCLQLRPVRCSLAQRGRVAPLNPGSPLALTTGLLHPESADTNFFFDGNAFWTCDTASFLLWRFQGGKSQSHTKEPQSASAA